jgi:hypothetical protein
LKCAALLKQMPPALAAGTLIVRACAKNAKVAKIRLTSGNITAAHMLSMLGSISNFSPSYPVKKVNPDTFSEA